MESTHNDRDHRQRRTKAKLAQVERTLKKLRGRVAMLEAHRAKLHADLESMTFAGSRARLRCTGVEPVHDAYWGEHLALARRATGSPIRRGAPEGRRTRSGRWNASAACPERRSWRNPSESCRHGLDLGAQDLTDSASNW